MSEMTIAELQQLRTDLEERIRIAAAEAVEEFQRRTGCHVEGVDVRLIEDTAIGDKVRHSVVSSVRIDATL